MYKEKDIADWLLNIYRFVWLFLCFVYWLIVYKNKVWKSLLRVWFGKQMKVHCMNKIIKD